MIIPAFNLAEHYQDNTLYIPCDKYGSVNDEADVITTSNGKFISVRTRENISNPKALNEVSGYYLIKTNYKKDWLK